MATVLIVDDEPSLRRLLGRFLTASFEVTCLEASDGAVALTMLLSTPVDLVILDLDMPVMDGIKTLETIRNTPALRAIPVVLITGRAVEERIKTALALGLATVLLKPFSEESLFARVRPMLAAHVKSKKVERRRANQLELQSDQRVLVVENDSAIRQLLVAMLGSVVSVRFAENEFLAMSACAAAPPDLIWLGETSGVWSREQLQQAVSELPHGRSVRFVASLPKDELVAAAASGQFAAVIRRTSDVAELETEFLRVLVPIAAAQILLRPRATLVQTILAALDDVELAIKPVVSTHLETTERQVVGSAVVGVSGLSLIMRVRASADAAFEIAGQDAHRRTDQVGQDEPVAAIRAGLEAWATLAISCVAMSGFAAALAQVNVEWTEHATAAIDARLQTSRQFATPGGASFVATTEVRRI